MLCPLLLYLIFQHGGLPDGNEDECKKEECAWWDAKFEGCSIPELNRTLYLISEYFEQIARNMPHEKQFRK